MKQFLCWIHFHRCLRILDSCQRLHRRGSARRGTESGAVLQLWAVDFQPGRIARCGGTVGAAD